MIFLSAGHTPNGIKEDPGAVANGLREADLAVEFRELVSKYLLRKKITHIKDKDIESLREYLTRIKTGSGSVVIEYHFDSSSILTANGTTSIVGNDADRLDIAFAKELVNSCSRELGLKNRGVISESKTHRGRLGLMRESGIVCLVELCFISNLSDLNKYNKNKEKLAKIHADIIERYEKLI